MATTHLCIILFINIFLFYGSVDATLCQMNETCVGPIGKIVSPEDSYEDEFSYFIDSRDTEEEMVYIFGYRQDIDFKVEDDNLTCAIDIRSEIDDDYWQVTHNMDITLKLQTPVEIIAWKTNENCTWVLWFVTFSQETAESSKILTENEGLLLPPKFEDPILQDLFGYKFNTLSYWLINTTNDRISFNISMVDLGCSELVMHRWNQGVDFVRRDFLFIGSGKNVLEGSDHLLFGSIKKEITLEVNSNVAHVFFYSDVHHQAAKGFHIHYLGFDDEITTTTFSPPTVAVLPESVWLPLNGVAHNNDLMTSIVSTKSVIANLSNQYINLHDVQVERKISNDDVIVVDTKTCQRICDDNCVAFKVQLEINGKSVLTEQQMREMLSFQTDDWISVGREVQVCEEDFEIDWFFFVGIPCVIVVLVVVLASVKWKFSKHQDQNANKLEYQIAFKEEENFKRRHSDTSISSLPFPGFKPSMSQNSTDSSEFITFDPNDNTEELKNLGIYEEIQLEPPKTRASINPVYIDSDDEGGSFSGRSGGVIGRRRGGGIGGRSDEGIGGRSDEAISGISDEGIGGKSDEEIGGKSDEEIIGSYDEKMKLHRFSTSDV